MFKLNPGISSSFFIIILQVSSIYKDPSIGNLINIVIVKLVIINNELVSSVAFTTIIVRISVFGNPFFSLF